MREPRERVQAAILRDEQEPLAGTQARLGIETALRGKIGRLALLGLLALAGVGTAHETGALGLVLPKRDEPSTAQLAEDLKGVKALLRWLVRQEANRQVRDCVAAGVRDCKLDIPEGAQ